jgi:hypothetical protein
MQNKVMQIVPDDVSVFAKEIDTSLDSSSTGENVSMNKFGGASVIAGQAMAKKRMQPVSIQSCDIIYRAGGIEYDEWATALLLMARSAEFLRRKARDGQCYNHEQPCLTAREEEVGVYRACLDSFQTLLDEMKSKDINDPD